MNYGIIISLIFLVILAVALIFIIKKIKPEEEANKFVSDLSKDLIFIIGHTIEGYDPKDYDSIDIYRNVVLEDIYNNTWDYISRKSKEALDSKNILNIVFRNITKDLVREIVNKILENNLTVEDINGKYIAYINSLTLANESKLEEEYSNEEEYVEVSNEEDLEEAKEVIVPEEELAKLNPHTDEEKDFDFEDDSMELVVDKAEIICTTDKNGKELYYEVDADGKKKRVSKEYALKQLGE